MNTKILDAYFAGLIDGEGTVNVYAWRAGTNIRAVIKVDMTCEKTVRALHAHFGGYCGTKKHKPGNKPQWRWEVTYAKAKEVAIRIRPFLITKAAGADAILALKSRPVGRAGHRPKTSGA